MKEAVLYLALFAILGAAVVVVVNLTVKKG